MQRFRFGGHFLLGSKVLNPLPYVGRSLMVLGFDTSKASKDAPLFQALSASYNASRQGDSAAKELVEVYLTSYFSTWRKGEGHLSCPAPLMLDALQHFYQRMRRLPEVLVIYRGGCSESQEAGLLERGRFKLGSSRHDLISTYDHIYDHSESTQKVLRGGGSVGERMWAAENGEEHELHHPSDGFFAALDRLAEAEGLQEWRSKVAVAYIMARRRGYVDIST